MDMRTAQFKIPPNAPLAWRILWPLLALVLLLVTCSALVVIPIAAAGAYLVAALLGLVGIKPRPRMACPSCGMVFKIPTGSMVVCPGCDTVMGTSYTPSDTAAPVPRAPQLPALDRSPP